MGDEKLFDDRVNTAVSIGVTGSAIGGSAIGSSLVGAGIVNAPYPIVSGLLGVIVILASTLLAGWYMPGVRDIVCQWEEHQALDDGKYD